MKTILFLFLMTAVTWFISCRGKEEKCAHQRAVTYTAFQKTNGGDTINRITEKGKQGKWTYNRADGSTTDTVYKDGIPQSE